MATQQTLPGVTITVADSPPATTNWATLFQTVVALAAVGGLFWAAMYFLPSPSRLRKNPISTRVQSLLFSRSAGWTVSKANAWAQRHGYRHRDADVTAGNIRLRQQSPGKFRVLRTVTFGKGIKAVVGR
jgi:hypothetical protein